MSNRPCSPSRRRGVAILGGKGDTATSRQALENAPLLPRAITRKQSTVHEEVSSAAGGKLVVVSVSMQGWRKTMEDAHSVLVDPHDPTRVFLGVFDGHSNADTAQFVAQALPEQVLSALRGLPQEALRTTGAEIEKVISQSFCSLDSLHREKAGTSAGGTTATTVILTPESVICANVGDSRTVLCRDGGQHEALSIDHKPNGKAEMERIERAGSRVLNGRVDGQLGVSRAFGDYAFKRVELALGDQAVTCSPEIIITLRRPEDEFLVLGCDGIWECVDGATLFVQLQEGLKSGLPLVQVVERIVDNLCPTQPCDFTVDHPAGYDNMSIIVVQFLKN